MRSTFSAKLNRAIEQKNSRVCVGLDPRLDWIPSSIKSVAIKHHGKTFEAGAEAILTYNKQVIDVVAPLVPAVKPQVAFYEQFGPAGMQAFWDTVKYAQSSGLVVIADAKRGDIDSTAQAYANAFLGTTNLFGTETSVFDVDCITVNPFLGEDSLLSFIKVCHTHGKGVFILVKTSNPGSSDLQDQMVHDTSISTIVADIITKHTSTNLDEYGYSSIGAVVGATFPEEARRFRKQLPSSIFLVPGVGSQGGNSTDLKHFFNSDKLGAIVNSSRGITFSKQGQEGDQYLSLIEQETKSLVRAINSALQ